MSTVTIEKGTVRAQSTLVLKADELLNLPVHFASIEIPLYYILNEYVDREIFKTIDLVGMPVHQALAMLLIDQAAFTDRVAAGVDDPRLVLFRVVVFFATVAFRDFHYPVPI